MYIISKTNEFYDSYACMYGVDKNVTWVRRAQDISFKDHSQLIRGAQTLIPENLEFMKRITYLTRGNFWGGEVRLHSSCSNVKMNVTTKSFMYIGSKCYFFCDIEIVKLGLYGNIVLKQFSAINDEQFIDGLSAPTLDDYFIDIVDRYISLEEKEMRNYQSSYSSLTGRSICVHSLALNNNFNQDKAAQSLLELQKTLMSPCSPLNPGSNSWVCPTNKGGGAHHSFRGFENWMKPEQNVLPKFTY